MGTHVRFRLVLLLAVLAALVGAGTAAASVPYWGFDNLWATSGTVGNPKGHCAEYAPNDAGIACSAASSYTVTYVYYDGNGGDGGTNCFTLGFQQYNSFNNWVTGACAINASISRSQAGVPGGTTTKDLCANLTGDKVYVQCAHP
jgi:hypothetical protein